ncbi:hypothetical protein ElyMa_006731100 [Elysia marginata]|uniref:Uncharacterized protein n=1 Tax=Elysia marginata TaxID=1093978 RepID=A0AAV4IVY1_9GAST|nr:hypothetical protein ElyMa_006731100 [Elysia marginata]
MSTAMSRHSDCIRQRYTNKPPLTRETDECSCKYSEKHKEIQGSREETQPKSRVALVSMILDGPNIARRDSVESSQAVLSIARSLQYNSYVRRRNGCISIQSYRKPKRILYQ